MTLGQNKYIKHSHIYLRRNLEKFWDIFVVMKLLINHQFIQILAEIQLTKFSIKFVKRFFLPTQFFYFRARRKIPKKIFGEFELDESYFGAKRVRGKKGRGAAGKTPVFGLLKRDERVYERDSNKLHQRAINAN